MTDARDLPADDETDPVLRGGGVGNSVARLPAVMRDRDWGIHERGRELGKVAARHLPQDFRVTGDADAWPLIAAGLVSRMAPLLQSALTLHHGEREADAGILVCSLREHSVHLAWLAADPSADRIEEWRKHDLRSRLRADTDVPRTRHRAVDRRRARRT